MMSNAAGQTKVLKTTQKHGTEPISKHWLVERKENTGVHAVYM
jgi:hypothetical protein